MVICSYLAQMCQRVLKQIRKEATTENYAPEEKRFKVLFEEAKTGLVTAGGDGEAV